MCQLRTLLWQQLRMLQNWRPLHHYWNDRRCCQSKRHAGGQEKRSKHNPKQTQQQQPQQPQPQPRQSNTNVVPLLHLWMQLRDNTPISHQRTLYRQQLEQQPVMQNLRQVFAMHWNRFCGFVFSIPSLGAVISSQTLITEEGECPNLIQNLFQHFTKISHTLETALDIGSSSSYTNTSAAMGIIDFSEAFEQFNSLLIDHLVNNDEFMLAQSLTQLNQLY